jgi:hypothetical protein
MYYAKCFIAIEKEMYNRLRMWKSTHPYNTNTLPQKEKPIGMYLTGISANGCMLSKESLVCRTNTVFQI